jgi:hypothetical protein
MIPSSNKAYQKMEKSPQNNPQPTLNEMQKIILQGAEIEKKAGIKPDPSWPEKVLKSVREASND